MSSAKPTMNVEDQLHMSCALQDLGLCGCGTTEKWSVLLSMLERAADGDKSFYDPIGDVPANVRDAIKAVKGVD